MNNITVICNEEHEIVPGACALCERDQLREQNKELVEALESLMAIEAIQPRNDSRYGNAFRQARTVLAKIT